MKQYIFIDFSINTFSSHIGAQYRNTKNSNEREILNMLQVKLIIPYFTFGFIRLKIELDGPGNDF